MLYPSDIAIAGAGIKPSGIPWKTSTRCSCCGKPIEPGDLAANTEFGSSFMDDHSLAYHSGAICGSCVPLLGKVALQALQKVVVTRTAVYPIAKDVHRAWLFMTPPEPPWVAVVSDSMQQHLIWRTPVTLSTDLMKVRLGQRVLTIRRPILLQAIEWAKAAVDAFVAANPAAAKKAEDLNHPYLRLDREMKELQHGVFRPDIEKIHEAQPWLDKLATLTPGETWALATLAKRVKPTPEQPEPLTLKGSN